MGSKVVGMGRRRGCGDGAYGRGWSKVFLVLVFVIVSFLWASSFAYASDKGEIQGIERPSFVDLFKKLKPTVVNISTEKVVKGGGRVFRHYFGPEGGPEGGQEGTPGGPSSPWEFFGEDFFNRFFGDVPERDFKQKSLGSGFIISKDGYILTNNHVVEGADKIKVRLSDEKEFDGKIIGKDAKTDIALIKVDGAEVLPFVALGDSSTLEVGEWVVAIGNPFGLEHTLTVGIVSAKGRVIGAGPYDDFIQTDASINPGNSGGPLINTKGEVVGINTAIIAQGQGIGFATPINVAKEELNQLKEKGRVVRGWLGVMVQKVTPELAKSFGLEEGKGALVGKVEKGSPAEKAGVKKGDIIVKFGGKEIREMSELPRIVAGTAVGKKLNVVIFRDGKEKSLQIEIGEMPEEKAVASEKKGDQNLGMAVQEITPELGGRLGIQDQEGVIVSSVDPGGPADEAGMRRGDVIKEINRKPVKNMKQFGDAIESAGAGENVLLFVKRGDDTLYVVVKSAKNE